MRYFLRKEEHKLKDLGTIVLYFDKNDKIVKIRSKNKTDWISVTMWLAKEIIPDAKTIWLTPKSIIFNSINCYKVEY